MLLARELSVSRRDAHEGISPRYRGRCSVFVCGNSGSEARHQNEPKPPAFAAAVDESEPRRKNNHYVTKANETKTESAC